MNSKNDRKSRKVEIRSILEYLRYVPRFFGLAPYKFTANEIVSSKIGPIYALLYSMLYLILYGFVICFIGPIYVSMPVMYWPGLFIVVLSLCSCFLCILRNGFQQHHLIDFIEHLREFDRASGYSGSEIGKRDAVRLRLIVWPKSCVPIFYYVIAVIKSIMVQEQPWLWTIVTNFFWASFMTELIVFGDYMKLIDVRFKYLYDVLELKQRFRSSNVIKLKSEDFKTCYLSLLDAGNVVNDHYNVQLLVWIVQLILYTTYIVYDVISVEDGIELLCHTVVFILYLSVPLYIFSVANAVGVLNYFEMCVYMSVDMYCFSALGFYEVNNHLSSTILLTSFMFLLIATTIA